MTAPSANSILRQHLMTNLKQTRARQQQRLAHGWGGDRLRIYTDDSAADEHACGSGIWFGMAPGTRDRIRRWHIALISRSNAILNASA